MSGVVITGRGVISPATPCPRHEGHDAWLTRRHNRPIQPLAATKPGTYFVVVRGNRDAAIHAAHGHGFPIVTVTRTDRSETGLTIHVADYNAARRLAAWQRDIRPSMVAEGTVITAIRAERNFTPLPLPKPKPERRIPKVTVTIITEGS